MIHTPAPDFTLADLAGKRYCLSEQRGRIVVVNFWSAECLWSRRADAALSKHLRGWEAQGVQVWGIASNAGEPEHEIRAEVRERGVHYPILLDPGQVVADRYGAIATPHFFVVDARGILRYLGALDDATFRQREPSKHYLVDALNALLAGRNPDPAKTPAYGCAIVRQTP